MSSEDNIKRLKAIINDNTADEKSRESAIYDLGELYAKEGKGTDLSALLKEIRPFFATIAKARTAKIVRTLLDLVSKIPNGSNLQVELYKESIAWAKEGKRTFLRQRLETKLAALYLANRDFNSALSIVTTLVREVKRLDDKAFLVEILLLESQIHHALKNLPKSRGTLTAARTSANSIYCPPPLQSQIDMQAGILHAEEKDYKTAYSYFYEAFESYNSQEVLELAVLNLKYMLLCKIMTGNVDEVNTIINGKLALKYAGPEVDAMKAVSTAYKNRSLSQFTSALNNYSKELKNDPIIHTHLSELYDTLLEQNLIRIIEPFSCVEISHIASLIELPVEAVEKKLSQMILDKKFHGILDQGNNCLIVFDESPPSKTYPLVLETIENMNKVVDSLYSKAIKLHS